MGDVAGRCPVLAFRSYRPRREWSRSEILTGARRVMGSPAATDKLWAHLQPLLDLGMDWAAGAVELSAELVPPSALRQETVAERVEPTDMAPGPQVPHRGPVPLGVVRDRVRAMVRVRAKVQDLGQEPDPAWVRAPELAVAAETALVAATEMAQALVPAMAMVKAAPVTSSPERVLALAPGMELEPVPDQAGMEMDPGIAMGPARVQGLQAQAAAPGVLATLPGIPT